MTKPFSYANRTPLPPTPIKDIRELRKREDDANKAEEKARQEAIAQARKRQKAVNAAQPKAKARAKTRSKPKPKT